MSRTIRDRDEYVVQDQEDQIKAYYKTNRGTVDLAVSSGEHDGDGFHVYHEKSLGEGYLGFFYDDWGQEGTNWYFVPHTALDTNIMSAEIRVPQDFVLAILSNIELDGEAERQLEEIDYTAEPTGQDPDGSTDIAHPEHGERNFEIILTEDEWDKVEDAGINLPEPQGMKKESDGWHFIVDGKTAERIENETGIEAVKV